MVMRYIAILALVLLAGCGAERTGIRVIANIPEASGICYDATDDSLYVVRDSGVIYQLSPSGKILRKKKIGKYDLEGIACDSRHDRLLAAVEGKDNILVINKKTLNPTKKINVARKYRGEKLLVKDKEQGLEGITIDDRGIVYLSNQSHHKYPHPDPSVIVLVRDLKSDKAPIIGIIDPRKKDIAGLEWHAGFLYMVSDTNDKLYRYNLHDRRIDRKLKLPKFAQEGIAFDPHGNLYLADDNGHLFFYPKSRIQWQRK